MDKEKEIPKNIVIKSLILCCLIVIALLALLGGIDMITKQDLLISFGRFLENSHVEFLYFLCTLTELRKIRLLCLFVVTILIFSRLILGSKPMKKSQRPVDDTDHKAINSRL